MHTWAPSTHKHKEEKREREREMRALNQYTILTGRSDYKRSQNPEMHVVPVR